MPYEKNRIAIPIASANYPEGVWFGSVTERSSYAWEVVKPKLNATAVFGTEYVPYNVAIGILSREHREITNEDIASALSCIVLASNEYKHLTKSRVTLPPVAVVRPTRAHQQNVAIIASPMLPMMVPMSFYSTGLSVCWMFTEVDASRRELVFTFIEWTYGDVAAECPIAQVYRDDMSPCDTCTINGLECKEKHLKSMWARTDLPPEIKKIGTIHSRPQTVSNLSAWLTVFDDFRLRLPASHKHLKDNWLGKQKRVTVGFHVAGTQPEITMGGTPYLVSSRVRKMEAARKAKHTVAKKEALCSKCVLKDDCSLFRYSSSCIAFPSRNDLLEYVVHNDGSMSVEDALTSLLLTTFSAHHSHHHPLPPAPGTRVSRTVVMDGISQSGFWCVRVLGDYKHLRNPGQKDNVQIKLASYEELCLWLMTENPPLWKAYQSFLSGSVADKIRNNFSWEDACSVMTARTRSYVYSSSMAPYTSRTFGEDSTSLSLHCGGASTRYALQEPWWGPFDNVPKPSMYSGSVEVPAGAIRTKFTA